MKKILCLALALLMCASLMIACGDDPAPEVDDLKAFTDALAASAPKTAKVNTTLESALGELNAEYSVTYGEDGTAELVFTREQFNEITADTTEFKSTVTGSASIDAAGNLTGDLGEGAVSAATVLKLALAKDKMTYTVDGGILTATVSAENVQSVLGVNTGAETTVKLTVANGVVSSLTVSYTTAEGPATVVAVYTY